MMYYLPIFKYEWILLESPDGSRQVCVSNNKSDSVNEYDGWTELGRPSRKPGPCDVWDLQAGDWYCDPTLQADQDRMLEAKDSESILQRIEELEQKVSDLETQMVLVNAQLNIAN